MKAQKQRAFRQFIDEVEGDPTFEELMDILHETENEKWLEVYGSSSLISLSSPLLLNLC
jgi:hypothetical protein